MPECPFHASYECPDCGNGGCAGLQTYTQPPCKNMQFKFVKDVKIPRMVGMPPVDKKPRWKCKTCGQELEL
jgi:hypothetical protein